jgi:hypothetical protein
LIFVESSHTNVLELVVLEPAQAWTPRGAGVGAKAALPTAGVGAVAVRTSKGEASKVVSSKAKVAGRAGAAVAVVDEAETNPCRVASRAERMMGALDGWCATRRTRPHQMRLLLRSAQVRVI